jgi:hypothetical protein
MRSEPPPLATARNYSETRIVGDASWFLAASTRARQFAADTLGVDQDGASTAIVRRASPHQIASAFNSEFNASRAAVNQWLGRLAQLRLTDGKAVTASDYAAVAGAGLGGLTLAHKDGPIEVLVDRSLPKAAQESVLVHEYTHVLLQSPELETAPPPLANYSNALSRTAVIEMPALWVEGHWQRDQHQAVQRTIHAAGVAVLNRQAVYRVPTGVTRAGGAASAIAEAVVRPVGAAVDMLEVWQRVRSTPNTLYSLAGRAAGANRAADLDLGVVETFFTRAVPQHASEVIDAVTADRWVEKASCFEWQIATSRLLTIPPTHYQSVEIKFESTSILVSNCTN